MKYSKSCFFSPLFKKRKCGVLNPEDVKRMKIRKKKKVSSLVANSTSGCLREIPPTGKNIFFRGGGGGGNENSGARERQKPWLNKGKQILHWFPGLRQVTHLLQTFLENFYCFFTGDT